MKFGYKLRQERLKADLTQEELARALGITCRTLQNYESGMVYPKKREIYGRLADFFGTEVDYWLSENTANAQSLVQQVGAVFGAEGITEEELDELMRFLQTAYWEAKDRIKNMQQGREER